jgi:DNA polymerase III delta subunit
VGGDLRRLMGELEKLETFAEGRAISAEDVASLAGRGLGRPL